MAGVADMTVRVGADISEVMSKVEAARAKLNQLGEANQELKNKIKETNGALSANQKELNQADKALQKLIKSGEGASAAAKELRNQIRGISASTSEFKNDLVVTQKELAANTAQIKVQTKAVRQAEIAGSGFTKGLNQVWGGLRKVAYLVPGLGIAGLVGIISGPLVDAFADWYASINKVSEAQKILKANLENYNDINAEANKNAAKQTTSLQILYQAATNVNLSMKERLAAVKGLQNEFPDYFKNINQENILNGNSKAIYDELTESILKRARADAAVNKLREIGAKQLDNDIQRQKILNATTNEANAAQKLSTQQQQSLGQGQFATVDARALALNAINARKEAALKTVEQNKKELQEQANFIQKFIGLSDLAASVESDIKPPKEESVKKIAKAGETIEDVLKKLQVQINFINQKPILPEQKVKEEVSAIESTISNLMQKFKLLSDNPVIIKLRAQAADLELSQLLKRDSNPVKIDIPAEFKIKPETEIKLPDGAFDEEILREQIQKELKKRGISKAKPIQIGIDISGNPIMTDRESITGATSTDKLLGTLEKSNEQLQNMANLTTDVLGPAFDSLFTGILTNSDTAFEGFANAVKGALIQLSAAVLKAAALAAIFSLITGNPFGGQFKKILGFSEGGLIKGHATGGYIQGPGTKTSDSILARLSKGEYVIKASTVDKFGLSFFERLNKGMMPKFDTFGFAKFAQGGYVSPNIIRTSQVPTLSGVSIGGGQILEVKGNFELRNDRLVAAVSRGNAKINRNS